jgi:UDP-N-acetylmuramoylalanine--D-glutamate ligase
MYDFRADVAILLNITPDHLDRYGFKMENYAASKMRITQNQKPGDAFIYFADDEVIAKEINGKKFVQKLYPFCLEKRLFDMTNFLLKGAHNYCNVAAALLAAKHLGLDFEAALKSAEKFPPIEHRIEPCGKINGVEYINDSKGTNVDAVKKALCSVNSKVILILGGVDKGNDYNFIMPEVKEKVREIVAMGVDNAPIHKAFDGIVPVCDVRSMKECIEKCAEIAKTGETVLLSPACASFDLFTCYEDRGEQFRNEVKKRMKNE